LHAVGVALEKVVRGGPITADHNFWRSTALIVSIWNRSESVLTEMLSHGLD